MTVAELVEKLKEFPQDADVIYRCCSDWAELDAELVRLVPAEKSRAAAAGVKFPGGFTAVQYRGGRYVDAYARELHGVDEEPVYRTVVCFPGN